MRKINFFKYEFLEINRCTPINNPLCTSAEFFLVLEIGGYDLVKIPVESISFRSLQRADEIRTYTSRRCSLFFSFFFFSTWRRGNNPCHRFRHIFLSFFFSFPFLFFSSLFFFPSRRLIVDSRISLARSIRADSKSSTCVAFLISVKFRPPDLRVNVR